MDKDHLVPDRRAEDPHGHGLMTATFRVTRLFHYVQA